MKTKYIIALLIIVVLVVSGYFVLQSFNRPPERKILYYQSGMHPWIKSDKPGKCPLCGMDLMPVYEEKEKDKEQDKPLDRARGKEAEAEEKGQQVRLTKKQLENINVETVLVKRRKLFNEIRTVGEVAYDPALLVAEEEFVAAVEAGDQSLTELAKRKLRVLGLSLDQISRLQRDKKVDSNLLLPESKMWVYADIYEHELGLVRTGAKAKIKSVAYPGQTFYGRVRSIEPILSARTRSARLRIEVNNPGLKLKPQMYVDVYLSTSVRLALSIPKEAVLDTGQRKVVYVEKEHGVYEPREVSLGHESDVLVKGQKRKYFSVIKGLLPGEKVVTSANFLIDSQSQLTGGSSSLYGGASEVKNHDR